jgi:hypothetical protein
MVLGAAAFVAVGAAMAFGPLGDDDSITVEVVGWVAMVCFSFAGILGVRQILSRDPVVIRVGPLGLHDRRLSRDPIPWDDIDGYYVQRIQHQRILRLLMTPEAQERNVHSRWRAFVRRTGGPTVNTGGLSPGFDDFLTAVAVWLPPNPPKAR